MSLKFQMLQILLSFVDDAKNPLELLCSLFEVECHPHTSNAIKIFEWHKDIGGPRLDQQQYMLELINHWQTVQRTDKEQLIYSELIESIKFDDRVTISCGEVSAYQISFTITSIRNDDDDMS